MKLPLYLKTYFSPFKPLKLKFYFGKISQGVPYFLPRKWVRLTTAEAIEKAEESFSSRNLQERTLNEWVEWHKNFKRAVPLKFGFSYCGLGWKTKFDSYRFEFSPIWSFVAFGYQLTLTFFAENEDQYWESFLAWEYETDKSLDWVERVKDCRKRFPQTWNQYREGEKKETVDYYKLILKSKYACFGN
jgi:hypothetical protein